MDGFSEEGGMMLVALLALLISSFSGALIGHALGYRIGFARARKIWKASMAAWCDENNRQHWLKMDEMFKRG